MTNALTAKNNCEIDGAFVVTATRLNVNEQVGLVVDVTFSVPASGPEVDFGSWKDDGPEHLIVFTEGALRIRLVGVKFGDRRWSSDPGPGNYEKTVKLEATDSSGG